jgi:predicted esterase
MKKIHFVSILFCLLSALFSTPVTLFFQTENKQAKAYLTQSKGLCPIIIFLDGSSASDAYQNHQSISKWLKSLQVHILTIEKPGNDDGYFDEALFYANDSLQQRFRLHMHLIRALQKKPIENWDSNIILLGVSEGAKLGAMFGDAIKEQLKGLVLISAGGGLPFEQEALYQLKGNTKLSAPEIIQLLKDLKYSRPHPQRLVGNKSTLWWHSLLNYHPLIDLLKIKAPILLLHGTNDTLIPVSSADAIAKAFEANRQKNLTYHHLENTGHAITNEMLRLCCNWLTKHTLCSISFQP